MGTSKVYYFGTCLIDMFFPQAGMAGIKLKDLRPAVTGKCAAGYSTSRTCEIGLSQHSGLFYRSIVYLVDKCTTTI